MKKLFLLILINLLFLTVSVAQQELDNLNNAFNKKDHSLLDNFFVQWKKNVPSANTVKDSMHQIANNLFSSFYDPIHLSKVSGYSTWDSLYNHAKYIAIQNELLIKIYKADSLKQQASLNPDSLLKVISIKDFRPEIPSIDASVLYLTPGYDDILKKFLGKPTAIENKSKLQFLNSYLVIMQNGTTENWFIETHPYVTSISFNKKCSIAKIDFIIGNQSGAAYYIKENKEWRMIWSGLSKG